LANSAWWSTPQSPCLFPSRLRLAFVFLPPDDSLRLLFYIDHLRLTDLLCGTIADLHRLFTVGLYPLPYETRLSAGTKAHLHYHEIAPSGSNTHAIFAMPRCSGCSKVLISKRLPEYIKYPLRTWSSGPELIRLSETGCDLCSFIRKLSEKSSTANLLRLENSPVIVLRDFHHQIALDYLHGYDFQYMGIRYSREPVDYIHLTSVEVQAPFPPLGTPYDPVLHARELFKSCVLDDNDGHRNCGRAKTGISTKADTLPRRLLDLSHDDSILMLDVQKWINTGRATVDELSDYCTLTYRWGKRPPDCMLRTDFIGEQVSSFRSLPCTFKDAIIIARALKIRFIWIDAMCIVQPSAHGDFTDWNVEGPRMWLVYQNAICNIAATCSSDPNDSFLSRVGTDDIAPCSIPQQAEDGKIQPIFLESTGNTFRESVVISSLNRRGWVVQERLLSRRILHFTKERVFWECQADNVNNDCSGYTRMTHWGNVQNPSLLDYSQWLSFIEFYSKSSFTQPADRLVALSSIARSVQVELFGTTYFAGIWKESLIRGLSWRSEESCSAHLRRRYLAMAPSWSWASVPGEIAYSHPNLYGITQSLVRLQDTAISLAQANNPYGNVERGALKFLARKCSMSLPAANKERRYCATLNFENLESVTSIAYWDELQDPSVAESMYRVVPLRITRGFGGGLSHGFLLCLIVISLPPTGDENRDDSCNVYRRIGWLEFGLNSKIREEEEEDHTHEISPLDLLDVIFPNSIPETIIII
jgi:hypothetical protein